MTATKMKSAGTALALAALTLSAEPLAPFGPEPPVPAFSISYLDRSIDPAADFYSFADGQWVKDNPVPADKARWGGFVQLAERNTYLIHALLEDAAKDGAPKVWDDNPNGNVAFQLMIGDQAATDAAFAKAKHHVKLRIENNRLTPVSMEPRTAIGDYNTADDPPYR